MAVTQNAAIPDWRHLSRGWEIPSEGYADQPYVVRADDGAWLCAMTTGPGHEGQMGQHVVSWRSEDRGRTWKERADVEPASGPEASYAVLLKAPGGRVYCFYNYNGENRREVLTESGEKIGRVDSQGWFVFKYSDDHGRTWSAKRYRVPVRLFACDRANVYRGEVCFFWNVGRPVICAGKALVPLHKVGAFGEGFMRNTEGVFLCSDNILSERDPEKIRWETLPDGEVGLRAPAGGGHIAEEQSCVELSDGSLFCVYRTIAGHPASAYSRDGGHTWSEPSFHCYRPGGRRFKHGRAANFVWKCANGKYLYWFHNHGGPAVHKLRGWNPYGDRNPAWICAGREVDGPEGKMLEWSQPEILLYDDDPILRMSYPDLIEEEGQFFVTETQKSIARVHAIDGRLLEGLWGQWEAATVAREGMLREVTGGVHGDVAMTELPEFWSTDWKQIHAPGKDHRSGFTLEMWVRLASLAAGQVVLDTRTEEGRGVVVRTTERGTIELAMQDGQQCSSWECDQGVLREGERQHVVIIVDGGPKMILFVVDGVLCDGGEGRQFGWGRFSSTLRTANGAGTARVGGGVDVLRVYGRALRVSEAVGNWRAEARAMT